MSMPVASPVFAPPLPPRRALWLRRVGATFAITGCVVLGAIALFSMLTLMSDPATPRVGFVPGPDGTPTAVVQRSGAEAVTAISVRASDTDRTVLWAIDRVPGSAWDGTVGLGTVPKGFLPSTAMRGEPIPAGAVLAVTNGCYASYATVPVMPLRPDVVTTEGQQVSLDVFYRDGGSFTPCEAVEFRTPLRIAAGGLVLLVAGLTALVVGGRRRERRRSKVSSGR